MAGHDAAYAGGNGRAKRNEFQMFEALAVGVNYRQVDVRIAGRIAVAGKVLGRGERAIFFDAADELGGELGDAGGIFAEGARVDDGIARIVVYVSNRGVDPMNAYGARF